MISTDAPKDLTSWIDVLKEWAPTFVAEHPVLGDFASRGTMLLHGSTTLGVVDPWSDIDIWLVMNPVALADFDSKSPIRFLAFQLFGKEGHVNPMSRSDLEQRVSGCQFPYIAELRRSHVVFEGVDVSGLLARSRIPMPDEVRLRWFRHHYLQMRQAHRALDNPIERGDSPTVLFGLSGTIQEALKAAMILDGEPYPYVKWLYRSATATPTGAILMPLVTDMLSLIKQGGVEHPGPEPPHPISMKLRQFRNTLIEAARAKGLDEPWLERWWHYIDASRDELKLARWPAR